MESIKYEIVDNFLKKEDFEMLQKSIVYNEDFPWHISHGVSYRNSDDGYYFSHLLYSKYSPSSRWYELLFPVFFKINPIAIHRVKCNLYLKTKLIL